MAGETETGFVVLLRIRRLAGSYVLLLRSNTRLFVVLKSRSFMQKRNSVEKEGVPSSLPEHRIFEPQVLQRVIHGRWAENGLPHGAISLKTLKEIERGLTSHLS